MFKIFKKLKTFGTSIGGKLATLFSKPLSEDSIEELEQILYEADLGSTCVEECLERVKNFYKRNQKATADELIGEMKKWALEILENGPEKQAPVGAKPHVVLLVGVNGSGKTTSCAKLAAHYKREGKKVLLAAGDTFRAAAVEQLTHWAEKVGVDIVKGVTGGDSSSVVFDAITKAKSGGYDVVIADTAGRLESKTDLMHELAKVYRVSCKVLEAEPQEVLLTVDATFGSTALEQARIFNSHIPLSGLILTKSDGSARGGVVLAIYRELSLPVLYLGTGEGAGDQQPFDSVGYVSTLFSR